MGEGGPTKKYKMGEGGVSKFFPVSPPRTFLNAIALTDNSSFFTSFFIFLYLKPQIQTMIGFLNQSGEGGQRVTRRGHIPYGR